MLLSVYCILSTGLETLRIIIIWAWALILNSSQSDEERQAYTIWVTAYLVPGRNKTHTVLMECTIALNLECPERIERITERLKVCHHWHSVEIPKCSWKVKPVNLWWLCHIMSWGKVDYFQNSQGDIIIFQDYVVTLNFLCQGLRRFRQSCYISLIFMDKFSSPNSF